MDNIISKINNKSQFHNTNPSCPDLPFTGLTSSHSPSTNIHLVFFPVEILRFWKYINLYSCEKEGRCNEAELLGLASLTLCCKCLGAFLWPRISGHLLLSQSRPGPICSNFPTIPTSLLFISPTFICEIHTVFSIIILLIILFF